MEVLPVVTRPIRPSLATPLPCRPKLNVPIALQAKSFLTFSCAEVFKMPKIFRLQIYLVLDLLLPARPSDDKIKKSFLRSFFRPHNYGDLLPIPFRQIL